VAREPRLAVSLPVIQETLLMKDYKTIFDNVESTIVNEGSRTLPTARILENLEKYKRVGDRPFSDADYYWALVRVVFYAGFKAATVDARINSIRQHFPDYEAVAGYDNSKIDEILSDPDMIKHEGKVRACVNNARTFKSIISSYGSFQRYIESFGAKDSFENLMRLRKELKQQFDYLSKITAYHFLTIIGMPVLKPDRVIRRIFHRLGFIESDDESEGNLLKTVLQGHKFAQATGHPLRYVDIVFVAYGQMKFENFGLNKGICLQENPRCTVCGVRDYCDYFARKA
jgi:DNA-3-methyladenine glycosylase I